MPELNGYFHKETPTTVLKMKSECLSQLRITRCNNELYLQGDKIIWTSKNLAFNCGTSSHCVCFLPLPSLPVPPVLTVYSLPSKATVTPPPSTETSLAGPDPCTAPRPNLIFFSLLFMSNPFGLLGPEKSSLCKRGRRDCGMCRKGGRGSGWERETGYLQVLTRKSKVAGYLIAR